MSLAENSEHHPRHTPRSEHTSSAWYGIPEVPDTFVRRDRLIDLLDRAGEVPLVLVSAPAGTGKTSLVADWVTAGGAAPRTDWVTFERDDAEFWPGVVGGLRRLGLDVPVTAPAQSDAWQRGRLFSLASQVARQQAPLRLVLDGYEMTSAAVSRDLDFLLRHSGHRLQIVLLTRIDPVLPLYRYRLDSTMTEIRMADLAFTDPEAGELMERCGVGLTGGPLHELNTRTRGWAAGLLFAARFLATREEPDRAVDEVGGGSGNIAEYLVGEVLAAQTPEVRTLLLSTSIPDVLRPGLAEALGGRSAMRTLAYLTRANAFIEAVPEHPGCYRYHPFFRELLRAELTYEAPDQMERLQRRAAEWFAAEGLLEASVSHFAAIGAWDEAAGEVVDELAVGQLLLRGPDSALASSLRSIPSELEDPSAAMVRATLVLVRGDADGFGDELAQMNEVVARGESRHDRAVEVALSVLQAVNARYSTDPEEAIALAEAAERVLGDRLQDAETESHPELLALVYASKGIASLRRGQLDQAHALLTSGAGAAVGTGCESLLVECLGFLALIACLRGELSVAQAFAVRAVGIADDSHIPAEDRPSAAQVALAWVSVERYDLHAAAGHVALARQSDFILGDPVARTLLALVLSRLRAAGDDQPWALATLEKAIGGFADPTSWLAGRLRVEALHLRTAIEGAECLAGSADLEARWPAEVAVEVARIRLTEGHPGAAREALAPLLPVERPTDTAVAAWLLETSRLLDRGSAAGATSALDRALALAAPERRRRPFREAPSAVRALLRERARDHDLAWLNLGPGPRVPAHRPPRPGSAPASDQPVVVERLTAKELEVLGHLAELLSTQEIADAMFVSVNTVRTHVSNILHKLGVPRRNAAVRRARELELLPR